jgi:hypothetical protein
MQSWQILDNLLTCRSQWHNNAMTGASTVRQVSSSQPATGNSTQQITGTTITGGARARQRRRQVAADPSVRNRTLLMTGDQAPHEPTSARIRRRMQAGEGFLPRFDIPALSLFDTSPKSTSSPGRRKSSEVFDLTVLRCTRPHVGIETHLYNQCLAGCQDLRKGLFSGTRQSTL